MQINSDKITFLVGDDSTLYGAEGVPVLPMFSEQAMKFLEELSRLLLRDKRTRQNVDVMSYAYWIRRANLERAKEKHSDYTLRLGRGIAFHIAPSNVPVNFAVSMTSSLLAGNVTIIRLSNKEFEQVDIICDAINEILKTSCPDMAPYLVLMRYEHDDEVTKQLSGTCDVRVIWGGNETIRTIRTAPLSPRAIELAFADRFSIAIIRAEDYLAGDPAELAKAFYTDTYYSDQNACSSPRLVMWMGDQVKEAKERFWKALHELVNSQYDMKPIQAIDKFSSFCRLAMTDKEVSLEAEDNLLMRVELKELTKDLSGYKDRGGYFLEYTAHSLEEIVPVLTKECQTISYLGIEKEEIKKIVFKHGVRGVDRIVPMGQTMGLEFVWDGYKMIEAMSRIVYIGE